MRKDFKSSIARTFHKTGFQLKKHSPEILIVAGTVGVVASAVMACKATTKLSGILEKAKNDIDTIHECTENPELLPEGTKYTAEDSKKDLTIVYAKTGLELVKLYAPAVTLGALSLGAIISSNNILRKRNVALAAAYTAVDKGFKEYRGRVVERFGKELDRELRYNIKAREIEEKVVDKDGKEKVVKKTVQVADLNEPSVYARCFDETCLGWDRDPEYNLFFIRQRQEEANKRLRLEGYLYLNDVYEMLGFQKSKAGQIVGWVYDEEFPNGDNYIDFGIYDLNDEQKRNFVNGLEQSIWLDFNVDGNIYDLMH